ncbi:uncharacterized protein BJX67DRAFT_111122 [Aspergillus lucknowensis]|uniref:Mid2 domain-containing protein n=1 Tax=Aspergillus lucknowensis TaxID=176173 RepID=A0ABR4LUI9_9EURO
MLLNSCTASSWESDDCPSICPKSMRTSYGIHILPCLEKGSSQWCCSSDGSDCCDDAFEFDIGTLMYSEGNWTSPTSIVNPPTATATAGTISSISNSDKATTTVTVTSKPTADSETCDNATCPDNETAAVGVGVGVGVGLGVGLLVCAVSSAGALFFQRRMYRKRLEETKASFLASGYLPAAHAQAELFAPARPPIAELPLNRPQTVFEM